jgi:hypothetical protein
MICFVCFSDQFSDSMKDMIKKFASDAYSVSV